MKLTDWLLRNDVKRVEFARRIGLSPGAVTQICREAGAWLSRETAERIVVETRGAVTPNDFLALAPSARTWADLGSGGGFPGVVLACALAETPGATVHLVERNSKKAAFLREALRVTGALGIVHLADIGESVDRIVGKVDCVTARAVAPLHQLIGFVEPLVKRGAKALLLKGQDVEAELTEATKYWNITPSLHPSSTGGHGWIVELDRIEPRNQSATAGSTRA